MTVKIESLSISDRGNLLPSRRFESVASESRRPGTCFSPSNPSRLNLQSFFSRFTTPDSECSFIAALASPRTFFISPANALSSTISHSPADASNTSPNPICLAGTFSFAPPFGPFRCTISPALCSSRNVRRTITALSFRASAMAADVCIASGSPARTARTRKLKANRAFCAMNKKLTQPSSRMSHLRSVS